jgi:hypothetical protein
MGYSQNTPKAGRIHRVWSQHVNSNFYHPKKGADIVLTEEQAKEIESKVAQQQKDHNSKVSKQDLKNKRTNLDSMFEEIEIDTTPSAEIKPQKQDETMQLSYYRKNAANNRPLGQDKSRYAMRKSAYNFAYEQDCY